MEISCGHHCSNCKRFIKSFKSIADLAKTVEVEGGAYVRIVTDPGELSEVLKQAMGEEKKEISSGR